MIVPPSMREFGVKRLTVGVSGVRWSGNSRLTAISFRPPKRSNNRNSARSCGLQRAQRDALLRSIPLCPGGRWRNHPSILFLCRPRVHCVRPKNSDRDFAAGRDHSRLPIGRSPRSPGGIIRNDGLDPAQRAMSAQPSGEPLIKAGRFHHAWRVGRSFVWSVSG